jgi:predicted lipoprotein with Yx(FWY)xxD motif
MRRTGMKSWAALFGTVTLTLALLGGTSATAATKTTVRMKQVPGVGLVLARSDGHTLYTLTDASGAAVECTGACASAWPPYTVSATAKVKGPKRLKKSLGTTSDTHQVTWKKLPLYAYAGDSKPRTANGNGLVSFGGTWRVVKVGKKSNTAVATPTTAKATSGYRGY